MRQEMHAGQAWSRTYLAERRCLVLGAGGFWHGVVLFLRGEMMRFRGRQSPVGAVPHTRLCHQVPVLPPPPLHGGVTALRAGQGVALCQKWQQSVPSTNHTALHPTQRTVSRRHTLGRSWSGTPPQASSRRAAKSTTGLSSRRRKRSWRPLTPGCSLGTPSDVNCGCVCAAALLPTDCCCVPRRRAATAPLPVAPAPLVPAQGNGAVEPSRPVTRRLPGSLRGLWQGGAPAAEVPVTLTSTARGVRSMDTCGRPCGCSLSLGDM